MIHNRLRFRTQVFLFMLLILALAFAGIATLVVPFTLKAQREWTFVNLRSTGQLKSQWIESGFENLALLLRNRTGIMRGGRGFGGFGGAEGEIRQLGQILGNALAAGASAEELAARLRARAQEDRGAESAGQAEGPRDLSLRPGASLEEAFLDVHDRYLRFIGSAESFFDILLVDAGGRVVYSAQLGEDLLQNLTQPPWDADNAARCFQRLKENPGTRFEPALALADFEQGAGRWTEEPLACLGVAVFETLRMPGGAGDLTARGTRGGGASQPAADVAPARGDSTTNVEQTDREAFAGAILARVPLRFINRIMTERAGLGESGETYLVGADFTARSETRSMRLGGNEANFPLETTLESRAARRALEGESGTVFSRSYTGQVTLCYYQPLDVFGVRWALIAEVGAGDASMRVSGLGRLMAWAAALVVVLFFASYAFARRVNRPIEILKGMAQRVGAGEPVDPLEETGSGFEFNELFNSFNTMTRQVRDRAVDIERARQAELRESEKRLRRQNRALLELTRNEALERGDFEAAVRDIAEAAARTLQVRRSSIWLFHGDFSDMQCVEQFDAATGERSQGLRLAQSDYPTYFEALRNERIIAAGDATVDKRFAELSESYLKPGGFVSLLDAPIRRGSQLVGVICNEHEGQPRHWALEEQNFAASLADLIALAMESAERRQAEEEQRKFVALVENSHEFIAMTTLDLAPMYINPAGCNLVGLCEEPSTPENTIRACLPDAEWDRVHGEILPRMREHGLWEGEIQLRHLQSSQTIDAQCSAFEVRRAETNEPICLAWVLRDITERKRAERAEHERQAAEAASRAKSAFLANMSHELRTPMNAIIGYSEMLVEEASEAGIEAFIPDLRKIHAAGRHLLDLINDVLDLSKIESGKIQLFNEDFSIAEMVEDALSMIRPLADKNGNALEVDCPPDIGGMRADLMKTRQALFNLLSNACKFTENGRVTVRIRRQSTGGRETIHFSVSDTGIGIAREKLDTLFEAFTQADASTTRKYGGTGLGLTISRRFCRLMGGDIEVKSELGKGSTFTLILPTTPGEGRAAEEELDRGSGEPRHAGEPRHRGTPRPTGRRALVVDDDRDARELMTRHLEKNGFESFEACDGANGLRLARELRPDVIILDVIMEGIGGWETLRTLKTDPDLRSIPVIMATVVADKDTGFALGADEYLTKPVNWDALAAILERYQHAREGRPILVVDDDTEMRSWLRRLLEKNGWETVEASDGRQALESLEAHRPWLILLDLMMPEMDGFEFLSHLRASDAWRKTPVVVLTARDIGGQDREALIGNVERILRKGGLSRDDLLQEVCRLAMVHADERPPRTESL